MRRSIMHHVLVAAASLAGAAVTFPAMGQVPVPVGPDCVCLRLAGVELLRRDLRLRDDGPFRTAPCVEKATAPPGVASDTLLVDEEQQRVPVAIEPHFLQVLHLAGGLALAP